MELCFQQMVAYVITKSIHYDIGTYTKIDV